MRPVFIGWLFLSFGLFACKPGVVAPPYKEEPVIECLLLVGRGIEEFKFTRTLPVGSEYDSVRAGISGASIHIRDEHGNRTTLTPNKKQPGVYSDLDFVIQPRTTYYLSIDYHGNRIRAQTTTPDTFSIMAPEDSLFIYLKNEIRFRWSESAGAAAYYLTVTNREDILIKIPRKFSEENPYTRRRTRFFWTLGTGSVIFPWLHNYYGKHELRVYAIDENFYHYLQTSFQDIQQLTEPESSVTNAIGYFGSGVMHRRFYTLLQP